ncbi:MAG TPA: peptidoglycan-associated lipoprotein Pal [Desulfuromonadaceae bacterium]
MRRGMVTLLAALSMTALTVGGCANKEVVKTEEPIVQKTQPAPKVETQKPTPPRSPVEQPKVEEPRIAPPQQEAQAGSDKRAAAEVNFDTIYFDFDKADLRQDARDALNKNAEILLKQKADAKVKIEGHGDERGSAEYNLALGERRAKSALQYLLTLGVPAERMSVISYGKEKPAVQGSDENAWAKNRRAEFVIVR